MMLIIFLGLIATLTSVCDGCDFGTTDLKYFDWDNVCMYCGIDMIPEIYSC